MLTLAAWPRPHHTVSETWQARHLEFDLLVKIVCSTIIMTLVVYVANFSL